MVKTTKEMITEIKETKINFKAKEINAQYAMMRIAKLEDLLILMYKDFEEVKKKVEKIK